MINNGIINSLEFEKYIKKGCFTMEKHPDTDLKIYGYHSGPLASRNLRWNNVTRQMRGLVTDSKGEIKARSFEKFFTFIGYTSSNHVQLSDGQLALLPNRPYKVYEKLDGTLTLLYWIDDIPYLATQRSFTSLKAKRATEILHSKYSHLFSKLKKDRTYIFEAIYPESKVLIDYGEKEELILLGIIDNKTGKDFPLENIGFPVAKEWTDELSHLKTFDQYASLNLENKEGFVIVYDNGFRIKIKFPWYKEIHTLINKVIQYEYHIDILEKKIRNSLNLPDNVPTIEKIWKCFENKQTPCQIIKKFPNQYKYIGIQDLIEREYNEYLEKVKNINSNTIIPILPEKNKSLIIDDLVFHPASENIMWGRWKDLENKYD